MLHRLFGLDPWPAAARPAGPGVERDLQAKPLGRRHGVLEDLAPRLAHELDRARRDATQLELGKARTNTVKALAEGGQTVLGQKIDGVYQKNLIDTKNNQLKEWDEIIESFKKGVKAPAKKDKNVVNGILPKNNKEE